MIRKVFILLVTPLFWRKFPKRKALALLEFSTIEKDSGNQLLRSMYHIKDPEIQAHTFQHVLEEYFHSDLFLSLSENYSDSYLTKEITEKDMLLDKNSNQNELFEFFAYVHVGEERVNKYFSYFTKSKKIDPKISSIFKRVSEDEENHIHSTNDILLKLLNFNKNKYHWLVLKSNTKRNIKHIQRYSTYLGAAILHISLTIIYFILGYFTFKKTRMHFFSIDSKSIVNEINDQQIEIGES